MYPHRIRLRGPWQCQPLTDDGQPAGKPLRMKIPCRWGDGGLGDFLGKVRITRHFGYPGRIDSFERVWLTFDHWAGAADIQLNNVTLQCDPTPQVFPVEFEVTDKLGQRNTLQVELDDSSGQGGLTGDVAMEIRCTAYLKNVCAERAGREIRVLGDVVGTCDRTLEVYVQCDGANVGYQEVDASPDGTRFQFTIDAPPPAGGNTNFIRVELVNVSTIWYVVELQAMPNSTHLK